MSLLFFFVSLISLIFSIKSSRLLCLSHPSFSRYRSLHVFCSFQFLLTFHVCLYITWLSSPNSIFLHDFIESFRIWLESNQPLKHVFNCNKNWWIDSLHLISFIRSSKLLSPSIISFHTSRKVFVVRFHGLILIIMRSFFTEQCQTKRSWARRKVVFWSLHVRTIFLPHPLLELVTSFCNRLLIDLLTDYWLIDSLV